MSVLSSLNRWMIVFIYSPPRFPLLPFPALGICLCSRPWNVTPLSRWGAGDRAHCVSTYSQSFSNPFYLVVFFSLLLPLFLSLYLLSIYSLSASVSLYFAQVYRATLIWENKHYCLSMALSQTGPHKHW